ncbi:phosphotransferase family protein [Lysobacter enzymogenes]|uniref:Phosphotransferase family protein n=1 Tax=Lysobacter enzymogenes TaxID=69 RepID=A0A0S2DPJ8_LYSEN|nr:phosphotransferase [Lysobacter enzymogenes]ALN60313.1 phosphotransferase family protein [Lysobacter enzymogenes]
MRSREAIAALIPHQGLMCLWEEVLEWDPERIVARSEGHRDPAHPLRERGRLHALHLCEYGAQLMAVHGGLLARAHGGRARPGVLVALRGVELRAARIDDLPGALEGRARQLAAGEGSWQYEFEVLHAGELLASGRAAVMAREQETVDDHARADAAATPSGAEGDGR